MPLNYSRLYVRLLMWRERKIKERTFILILSLIIGILCALAAYVLHGAIVGIRNWLIKDFSPLLIFLPIVGIFLTIVFVKYLIRDDVGHGVSKILYSISKTNGRIKAHNTWTSIIASSLTIGFGGSVGAEAPIVLTGASIGSNLGRLFKMNHKTLILLMGCGAAGAIAGIFKAPIAGLVFVLEVLMIDLTMASLIPLLISAVTAAFLAYMMMGNDNIFTFPASASFDLEIMPYILVLGLVCGFCSLFFTRGVLKIEKRFAGIKNTWTRLLLGGALLSLLIYLFPPLRSEGYSAITTLLTPNAPLQDLLSNSFFNHIPSSTLSLQICDALGIELLLLIYLILTLLFKILATSTTTGIGGVGGIFAPTLFLGAFTGFIVARTFNLMGDFNLPESIFALVGMAGAMSGVMYAPLTGIFLIAELTGGYSLIIPLMTTSTVSYLTVMAFEKHGIYTKHLAQRGELLTHHKDKAVLTLLKLDKLIETDLLTVNPNQTLGDLVKTISKSKRNIFPVVDKDDTLIGIVLLDDVRSIIFTPENYDTFLVKEFMSTPSGFVVPGQTMEEVMELFESTQAWNLPVVDKQGKYMGFVSKSKIFNSYRRVLVHYSDE